MRKLTKQLKKFYRKLIVPHFHSFPNYIIIGTMKGGTTSLYSYLCMRPDVHPATAKEIHYFDNHYHQGTSWYKTHFPMKKEMLPGQITGESSPYYLAHPCVPERIYRLLPEVKLIVLLRNPVERAYSHYQHNRRLNREPLTFDKALESEDERIAGEEKKMSDNPKYCSYNHPVFSYKRRGLYAEQLKRWLQYFPREQLLIIKSEDFFDNPKLITDQVCEFLGLKPYENGVYEKHNYFGSYSNMSEESRILLSEYFAPYNKELYNLLGVDYNW